MANAKKMSRKEAEAFLKEQGVDMDWSKLDFASLMQFIRSLIAGWKSHPQAQRTISADPGSDEHHECIAAHFEAIKELCDCGIDCCCAEQSE